MKRTNLVYGVALMLFTFAGFSCSRYDSNPAEAPDPENDEALVERDAADTTDAADAAASTEPTPGELEPGDNAELRKVVLAGGCFWCVEAVYEQLDGVIDVESGYAGGDVLNANYKAVSSGQTKHAEVVRITYDPGKITYGTILKVFFTTAHDPTTLNRQGADVGPQYRSAIFYASEKEKQIAANYIKLLNDSGVFRDPIVTSLEPLDAYYPAEGYHQDYAKQNPNDRYIQGVSLPKVEKTKKAYGDLLKDDAKAD